MVDARRGSALWVGLSAGVAVLCVDVSALGLNHLDTAWRLSSSHEIIRRVALLLAGSHVRAHRGSAKAVASRLAVHRNAEEMTSNTSLKRSQEQSHD